MAIFRRSIWISTFLKRNTRRKVQLLAILTLSILVGLTLLFYDPDCQSMEYNIPVACLHYRGRLGNLMFMYAFHYLFAKKKDLKMVKEGVFDLQNTFDLKGDNFMSDKSFSSSYCKCLPVLNDEFDCGYDYKLDLWPKRKGVALDGFFQSWRYFIKNAETIRRLFTFREEIRTKVAKQLHEILQGTDWNYVTDHLIGIHIRRGDYIEQFTSDHGRKVPSVQYITRAMKHMANLYKRVKFLVCSNDIDWSRKQLLQFSNVYFADDNTAAEDMALLSLTNHTIITVGTFGWWAAFLTHGTTIYFKDIFIPNSKFAAQFRDNSVDDFFLPSWIGME